MSAALAGPAGDPVTDPAGAPAGHPAADPVRRARRGLPGHGRPGWSLAVLVAAAVVVVPVLAVLLRAAEGGLPTLPVGFGRMVRQTTLLLLGVGLGTLVLGCGLAWLTTAYRFPGRDVLVWLLVLPLAMPAYILGFVFLSTFDVAGDVQVWLRGLTGTGLEIPVRGVAGAALVMSLTLYPYVYLLARAAFSQQAPSTWEAARLLGASRRRAFVGVLLPLARPALAAGLALVMMEVLTDFATVQYFGVRTVSVGVYTTWRQLYDFDSAVQLASLVLLFAVAVLAGERLVRGRARFTQRGGRGAGPTPARLTGWRGWLAAGLCVLVLAGGFAVPVVQLLVWALRQLAGDGQPVDPRFGQYLLSSVVVAVLAAVACVAVAVVIGHALRLGGGRVVRGAAQFTTFGYAVPGAVIGIGTLLALAVLDDGLRALGVPGGTGLLVTGSVPAVLFAYVVRFLGPAHQAVDSSFAQVRPSLTQSALALGAGPWRLLGRVHLPLVRPGVGVALVLVAVDAVKELPVVLMLRPFGFTTVSVWVYQLASENLWSQAALPALVIVALATVPVALLFRQVRREDRAVR